MFEERYQKNIEKPKKNLLKSKKFWVTYSCLAVISCLLLIGSQAVSVTSAVYPEKDFGQVLGSFGQLVLAGDKPLAGEEDGVINILALGVGGNGYYGSKITDTIVILSIKLAEDPNQANKVSLLSIPRDFKVQVGDDPAYRKINEAYMRGELANPGTGHKELEKLITEWTGVKIHYYALLDFDGFKEAIDSIGGVDVVVDQNFEDFSFPNYTNGILPGVKFEAGPAHLNGERALQFVRSRHGSNGEGSDFARIRRQQKVLKAFRDKVNSLNFVSNLAALNDLANRTMGHFQTNMEPWEIKRVYDLVEGINDDSIKYNSLDPRTGLTCSEIDEATKLYFLKLCEGITQQDVIDWAQERF